MSIELVSIDTIPIMQEDGSFVDTDFATLHITHNGLVVAAPRVPLADIQEGAEVGATLQAMLVE